jgi:hypothetical protein
MGTYSGSGWYRPCPTTEPRPTCHVSICGLPVGEHASPPSGLPVLHRSLYACMPSPLPRRNRWVHVAHFPSDKQPSLLWRQVGFRIGYFEACSAFTHYGLHARGVTK